MATKQFKSTGKFTKPSTKTSIDGMVLKPGTNYRVEILGSGGSGGRGVESISSSVSTQPHYTKDEIQIMEFCRKNKYNWTQSNVIKYVGRYQYKNGLEDLMKALDYLKCEIYFIRTGKWLNANQLTINQGIPVRIGNRKGKGLKK